MHLEDEVVTLKVRVEHLEATIERLRENMPPADSPVPAAPLDQTQVRAWLAAHGVISQPSALEQAAAQRWFDLPEEDKQSLRAELDRLPAGPMVSDIVIEQRR